MHPSLRLSNLSSLPLAVRRFAVPASRGSFRDLDRLIRTLDELRDDSIFERCLPVFYTSLDPDKIPTEPPLNKNALMCAFLSVDVLRNVHNTHKATFKDLWPRLWAWLVFFDTHPELLPEYDRIPMCLELAELIRKLSVDDETKECIWKTSHVRGMVSQAWMLIVKSKDGRSRAFPDFCEVISDMTVSTAVWHLDEILDDADGIQGLVGLLIQSILSLLNTSEISIAPQNINPLRAVLGFLRSLGNKRILSPALQALQAIPIITAVANASLKPTTRDNPYLRQDLFFLCMDALEDMFSSPRAIEVSIGSGLVRCILYGSILPDNRDAHGRDAFIKILKDRLPAATIYRSVLAAIRSELSSYKHITDSYSFKQWSMYDDWVVLERLARDRISLLNQLEAGELSLLRACYNTECGAILEKSKLKRCSLCRHVWYCSVECQRADWRRDNHRGSCRSIILFDILNRDLAHHDLSFMRALLHRDVTERTTSVMFHDSVILANAVDPFVTVCDYTKGVLNITLRDMKTARGEDRWKQVNWDEYTARAARSGGKMELHMLIMPNEGGDERRVLFPQWSNRPAFHDWVLRCLQREGSNFNGEEEYLEQLVKDIVMVH
ncbi:hypothetical protein R3P38DRAFT_3119988 [Favolaschia claudopus]|uniref:MYND-type domain-containing protein n=1 Tax=Favolaschia claudopus TaxID=2862362 RepID=A0AAV9ZE67_9AGAR